MAAMVAMDFLDSHHRMTVVDDRGTSLDAMVKPWIEGLPLAW